MKFSKPAITQTLANEPMVTLDASVEPPRDAEIPMEAPVRGALDLVAEPLPA